MGEVTGVGPRLGYRVERTPNGAAASGTTAEQCRRRGVCGGTVPGWQDSERAGVGLRRGNQRRALKTFMGEGRVVSEAGVM